MFPRTTSSQSGTDIRKEGVRVPSVLRQIFGLELHAMRKSMKTHILSVCSSLQVINIVIQLLPFADIVLQPRNIPLEIEASLHRNRYSCMWRSNAIPTHGIIHKVTK